MTKEATLFTQGEIDLARARVRSLEYYRLTQSELRACRKVMLWDEPGAQNLKSSTDTAQR